MKAVVKQVSHNRILALGIVFLIIAFLVALLSAYLKHYTLGVLAAVLAIFGAALAIRSYLTLIEELKREKRMKS